MTTKTLYCPPDVDQAYADWKAACGPCALAALVGSPVTDLKSLFPGNAERGGWANPSHMQAALTALGLRYRKHGPYAHPPTVGGLPTHGLAFLQITGPWDAPGVPIAAAYRKTHWVAVKLVSDGTPSGESDEFVYDCNAGQEDGTRGDWWPLPHWERDVMAAIVAANKRATGWRIRLAIEVQP